MEEPNNLVLAKTRIQEENEPKQHKKGQAAKEAAVHADRSKIFGENKGDLGSSQPKKKRNKGRIVEPNKQQPQTIKT